METELGEPRRKQRFFKIKHFDEKKFKKFQNDLHKKKFLNSTRTSNVHDDSNEDSLIKNIEKIETPSCSRMAVENFVKLTAKKENRSLSMSEVKGNNTLATETQSEQHSAGNRDHIEIISDTENDDCILIESSNPIIDVDEENENVADVSKSNSEQNELYYIDNKGSPVLNIKPIEFSSTQNNESTSILNSSDVIFVDETLNKKEQSIVFISEEYIPLSSHNVPKPSKKFFNPLLSQGLNDTLFSKSEKKELEKYNTNTFNPHSAEEVIKRQFNKKRPVLIDGSNVAFAHSRQKIFSVEGLKIAIDYFSKMGHEVIALVPQMRVRPKYSTNSNMLKKMYEAGKIVFTPCKNLPGKSSMSYDDRQILQLACAKDAAIVSNDNYRDLLNENAAFKKLIENRVIGYTWCNDIFIVPKDPYGKTGPSLDSILYRNVKKT